MKNSPPSHLVIWIDAFTKIFCKYSLKKFKAKIGISPDTIHHVWVKSNLRNTNFLPKDLLIFYHFCRIYSPSNHQDFGLCYDIYNNVVHSMTAFLFEHLDLLSKCQVDYTLPNGIFQSCVGIVDTKEFPIQRSSVNRIQKQMYSGKSKSHSVKYQLIVQTNNGHIIHLYGPERGSMADISMLKTSGFRLKEGYYLLGDKAYQGHRQCVVPFKGRVISTSQTLFNQLLAKIRVRVEHIFSYYQKFNCCQVPWRHSLNLHSKITKILTETIQIEIENGKQRTLNFFMK